MYKPNSPVIRLIPPLTGVRRNLQNFSAPILQLRCGQELVLTADARLIIGRGARSYIQCGARSLTSYPCEATSASAARMLDADLQDDWLGSSIGVIPLTHIDSLTSTQSQLAMDSDK